VFAVQFTSRLVIDWHDESSAKGKLATKRLVMLALARYGSARSQAGK